RPRAVSPLCPYTTLFRSSDTANAETCRGSLIRDVEDDLAHDGAIVELPDRRGGFGQRIPRVDERTQPAAGDVFPERLPLPGDERGVAEGRSAPGHSVDRDVLQQQPLDLDPGDLAGGETENQQTPERREHTGGVGETITSDRIEDISDPARTDLLGRILEAI